MCQQGMPNHCVERRKEVHTYTRREARRGRRWGMQRVLEQGVLEARNGERMDARKEGTVSGCKKSGYVCAAGAIPRPEMQ